MYIDISTDDKLSKLSLRIAYLSITTFILSVLLNVLLPAYGLFFASLVFSSFILAIFGIIFSGLARQNEEEHISRCVKARIINIILVVIYVTIYVFN